MEKARNVIREVRRDKGKIAASRGGQKRLLEISGPQTGSSRCISTEKREQGLLGRGSSVGRVQGFFREC